LSKYKIIVAPVLYLIKPNAAKNIENFVEGGGTFVTTFFSGIVNENDLVTLGGYPGELRKLLGIWAEEIDVLFPDMSNSIIIDKTFGNLKSSYSCNMLCDLVNLEGAEALAAYGSDFYKGRPVLTVNNFGKGKAYYIASNPEDAFIEDFMEFVCNESTIEGINIKIPAGVEVTQRIKDNKEYIFVLNNNAEEVKIGLGTESYTDILSCNKKTGEYVLEGKGVSILEKIRN
jgi:beta-galactosidase